MAHHKSAIKRIRTAERNRMRNRYYVKTMRTMIKKVLATTSKEEAVNLYNRAVSLIDKMVSKGIIHRNMGANKKSRLMRHVNSIS